MEQVKPIESWQSSGGRNFVTLYPGNKILIRVRGEGTFVFQGDETDFKDLLAKVKRKLGISR